MPHQQVESKPDSKSTLKQKKNTLLQARMKPIYVLAYVALAGFLLILVYSASTKTFFSVLGIATMVAAASALAGGLLGFVFGIPRTAQQQAEDNQVALPDNKSRIAGAVPSYQQNTNLEQISDWLTKILVGAGLTQVTNMQKWMSEAGQRLAPGFGGTDMSSVFASATVLSYMFMGFLVGYLWTRLYFAGALHEADLETVKEAQQETEAGLESVKGAQQILTDQVDNIKKLAERLNKIEEEREKDEAIYALVDRQLTPSMQAPKQEELENAFKTASRAGLAHIMREARHLREESWKNDKPRMERTIPIFIALTKIDDKNIAIKKHEIHGQLGFTMKDKAKPDWDHARKELDLAIELRGPWKSAPKYLTHYELVRGQCRIWQDKDFRENKPSAPDARQQILADLQIFHSVVGDNHSTWAENPIQQWLKLNDLSLSDLVIEAGKAPASRSAHAA